MGEVSILGKRTLYSSRPSSKPTEQKILYPLSVLDRVMQHKNLRLVFYYDSPKNRKMEELTRMLQESLSELLCSFPIVTGRLVKSPEEQWMVKYNDAGVRFVEARAKGSVHEWLKCVDSRKELKLVHWEPMLQDVYFWSPFYIQLTEFKEGGFAIGLSCTHLLSDLISCTMFIKAWADTTLRRIMTAPPFFHPLPTRAPYNKNIIHSPNADLINHYKLATADQALIDHAKQTTITLLFTDEMVRKRIAMSTSNGSQNIPTPTPFEALASLCWIRISKIKGIKDCLMKMSILLDRRSALGLDKFFFGNCMVSNEVPADDIRENVVSKACRAIQETAAKMHAEGIIGLIEWLKGNDEQLPLHGNGLICVNLEEAGSYSAIFEDGFEPLRASYYIEPTSTEGQVIICPSPPCEGVFSRVVMVTLPDDECMKFIDDKLIHELCPIILMGTNGF